ncbi:MAG TPA: hypothetical protein VFT95_18560 [Micromonosporaceae bacterium]|nr:hypothetical protein [Micromonosporaceae bacterium]
MTESPAAGDAAEPEMIPEQEIEFCGRTLRVKMPTPEQILVWKRILVRLQDPETPANWTAASVLAELERARKIIDSILADREDVLWLDDQFLDGTLGFRDVMPLIGKTVDAFAEAAQAEGNRADRRAAAKKTAPAKKAARKAPARKATA